MSDQAIDQKVAISREVAAIFERLGTTADAWLARHEKLSKGCLLGRVLAASRERLREVAQRLALHNVPNLGGARPADAVGAWRVRGKG
jgi:hypothetical protein